VVPRPRLPKAPGVASSIAERDDEAQSKLSGHGTVAGEAWGSRRFSIDLASLAARHWPLRPAVVNLGAEAAVIQSAVTSALPQ
jgi:hypothetical protein